MAHVPMPSNGKYPDYNWDKKVTAPIQDPFLMLRPFLQSWTVGFDQQFEMLNQLRKANKSTAYPPYNIKEIEAGCCYEIEMAVAGFTKEDIKISLQDGELTVEGGSAESQSDTYVHKGIAARTFSQSFALAEFVEVKNAALENGILTITLERQIPEEKKPKIIKIK